MAEKTGVYEKTYKRAQDRNSAIRRLKGQGYKNFEEADTEDGFYLKAVKGKLKIQAEEPDTEETKPTKKKRKAKVKGDPVKAAKKKEKATKAARLKARAEAKEKGRKKTSKKKKGTKKKAEPSGDRNFYGGEYWSIEKRKIVGRDGEERLRKDGDFRFTLNGVLAEVLEDHGDGTVKAKYSTGIRPAMQADALLSVERYQQIQVARAEGEAKRFKPGSRAKYPGSSKSSEVLRQYKGCLFFGDKIGWYFSGSCIAIKTKKPAKASKTNATKKKRKGTKKRKGVK